MYRYFFLLTSRVNFCFFKPTIFFVVCFLFCFLSGKSQKLENEFQLTGTILIKNKDFVYISYYNNIKQKGINDSCKIMDGIFFLKGVISQPAVAFIRLDRTSRVDDQTAIIFIEPSVMKIKILSDPFKVDILSGSKTNLEYDSLQNKKNLLQIEYKKQLTEPAETTNDDNNDELQKRLEPYYYRLQQLDFAFFDEHPQSFATGFLLQQYYRTLTADSLQLYYDAMGYILKESIYGDQLKDVTRRKKTRLPGNRAPDFSTVTNTNQTISLSDFKGRYVLLDFWAHWCVPCRKSSPDLIKLFNKYHNKGLEIIGVADDDFKELEWRKAIENDKIGIWYNVLRGLKKNKLEEIDKTESLNDIYNVHALPTRILIDHSGMIIGTYEGTDADEKLQKKLSKLFE